MLTPFYGNETLQNTLHRMIQNNRTAHGFLFYGEAGLGKKTLAQHLMAELLCTGTEKPCGICKACKMLANKVHPDICYVQHSGKLGGFSVDTVRAVCTDIATPPNEGEYKFYLFTDCDAMDTRVQNLLLKAIEEPPDYVYFIFTATAPSVLLPTIRSRIVSMAVSPVTEQQCRQALSEQGKAPAECDEAISTFHGNIGKCLEFLENEAIRETTALTKSAINSIINRNEYALLQTVAALGKDRERTRLFLTLFDRTLRDAMVRRYDPHAACIGCDEAGANGLAAGLSAKSGQAMHLAVNKAFAALQANVNLPLVMTAFCASCMDA